MSTGPRYPEWARITELMAGGSPVELAIAGVPAARLRLGVAPRSVALEIGGADPRRALPAVPDAIAAVRVVGTDGPALVISTHAPEVMAAFYALVIAVADEVQLADRTPEAALTEAIESFRRLLLVEPPESMAQQAGLFGELLLVAAHVRCIGPAGADAWVGPLGAPHDLRLAEADVEVKTTTTDGLVHMISSLGQLEANPGRPLHIVSIGLQVAQLAASAQSVADLVHLIRVMLATTPINASRFERTLGQTGWTEQLTGPDAPRFIVRHEPASAAVTDDFPRIVRSHLSARLGPDGASRIDRVQYSLDLAGLVQPISAGALADQFRMESR